MIQKAKNLRRSKGASLVGTLISISVLAIAIIGTASFRYYAAMDSRKAVKYSTAARTAVMLSESWQAVQGAETYDPIAHLGSDLAITESAVDEPEYDETFTLLGSYTVVMNRTGYHATLSSKNVSTGLRALNVIVSWLPRGGEETGDNKSFKLTTYAIITE